MKDLTNENVIHVKKDGVEFLQFRKLLQFSDYINHAYSLGIERDYKTKNVSGKMMDEQLVQTINNYKDLSQAIEADYTHIIKPNQEHTKEVKCIEEKEKKQAPDFYSSKLINTDGLITNRPNLMLATSNADCILLLFYDPIKKVIANVHSGWKGTIQRIAVEAVNKMKNNYNSNPNDIICCMCPSIRKCHFEVEKEVKKQFENEFKELNGFINETVKNKKWNIDTILINREILKMAGLQEKNIVDSGICSVCNSNQIHSYRVEGENFGLSTAIIEIKG